MFGVYVAIAAIFGCVFGSFYNVVIYRLPLSLPIAKGRSMCTSCKTTLRAKDLVPIFSHLFLGGKCRYCKERISLRYTIVELLTGFLFGLAFYLYGATPQFLVAIGMFSLLVIIGFIDYDTMEIYNSTLVLLFLLAVVRVWLSELPFHVHAIGLLVGGGSYLLIHLVAKLVFKRDAFGMGDVFLMGILGLYFGTYETIVAALLPFYIAVVYIVFMWIFKRKMEKRKEIPFGPFICLAACAIMVFGHQIVQAYFSFLHISIPYYK